MENVGGLPSINAASAMMPVELLQRSGFVVIGMRAAARFALRCSEIESEPPRNTTEQFDLKQYCSSVVVLCAAAVDAFKNELLHDYIAEPRNLTQDQAEELAKGAGAVPKPTPDPLRQVDGTLRLLGKEGLDLTPLTVDESVRTFVFVSCTLPLKEEATYGYQSEPDQA